MLTEGQSIIIACIVIMGIVLYVTLLFILERFNRVSFDLLENHLRCIGYVAIAGFVFVLLLIIACLVWRLVT